MRPQKPLFLKAFRSRKNGTITKARLLKHDCRFARITRISDSRESPGSRESVRENHATKVPYITLNMALYFDRHIRAPTRTPPKSALHPFSVYFQRKRRFIKFGGFGAFSCLFPGQLPRRHTLNFFGGVGSGGLNQMVIILGRSKFCNL